MESVLLARNLLFQPSDYPNHAKWSHVSLCFSGQLIMDPCISVLHNLESVFKTEIYSYKSTNRIRIVTWC